MPRARQLKTASAATSGRRISRRGMLKVSFSFSAASLLASRAYADRDTALPAEDGPPSPPFPDDPAARQVLIWGDWGADGDRKAQTAVAQAASDGQLRLSLVGVTE